MTVRAREPAAGRICPVDYRYHPSVFSRPPDFAADALYVAGGVYGNLEALSALERIVADEPGARLVLAGDYHWFDAEPARFAAVEAMAARHLRIRGNVETELARGVSARTGCGCAYPEWVDEDTVARSNAIIERLGRAAPAARLRLAEALPMHLVASVGSLRVAVVHGDAESLAGWRFDRTSLDDPATLPWLNRVRGESGVDVFASTHTCSPVLRRFDCDDGPLTVVNNGAAGMPNGEEIGVGIVTRIGAAPSPVPPLYGLEVGGVHVDALPLRYDHEAFIAAFDACWPAGSPAEQSYRRRITQGAGGALMREAPPRRR